MTAQGDFAAQAVLAQLGWGRDNARSLSDIAEALNCPRRAVEKAVQELRLAGKAIASAGDGVWLGDAADMAATAEILRGRLISQYRTLRAVRATTARLRAMNIEQLTWTEAA